MQEIKEYIKNRIAESTSTNPVTSTRLIKEVREQFGRNIGARTIRFWVDDFRKKDRLAVLARKREPLGYFAWKQTGRLRPPRPRQ